MFPSNMHLNYVWTSFTDIRFVFYFKIHLELGPHSSATRDTPSLATGQTELAEKECFASLFSGNISLEYIEAILQLAGE